MLPRSVNRTSTGSGRTSQKDLEQIFRHPLARCSTWTVELSPRHRINGGRSPGKPAVDGRFGQPDRPAGTVRRRFARGNPSESEQSRKGDHRADGGGSGENRAHRLRGATPGERVRTTRGAHRNVGLVVDLQLRRATGRAERDREVHPVTPSLRATGRTRPSEGPSNSYFEGPSAFSTRGFAAHRGPTRVAPSCPRPSPLSEHRPFHGWERGLLRLVSVTGGLIA